ncbi:MAG: glycosyltransferase family 39 protein [Chloroflexi bacterium]|nr:glycosyltransferase family 39 protein [Chloroflexota bacterium]
MPRSWFFLTLLASLPAALFLAQDGFFSSSDGMIHLYRLFELDRSFHAGDFFPRWFPLAGYGYGLPVLNYYPPLAYYLAEFFHLLGAGYLVSIKLLIAFSLFTAAISMFIFARDVLGDAPAFVAGVAYAYLPYILSDAYVRGNFPELLAVALIPLALFAFRRAFTLGAPRDLVLSALAFAAIILAHHLTAMQFAGLLGMYLVWLFIFKRDVRSLARCGAAIAFGLVLSAFYWMPALGELNLALVGPESLARFLVSRLVSPEIFFAPHFAYEYLPQSETLQHTAGFPQTLVALASCVLLFRRHLPLATYHSRITHLVFFYLILLSSIAMMLTISAPVWYAIPTLRFMQFPWRFQILAGISIAFLSGLWFARLKLPRASYPLAALALIALALVNLPVRVIALTDAQVDLTKSDDAEYVVAQMGWGWTREFVPATVREFENIYAPITKPATNAPSIAPGVQIEHAGLDAHAFRVATAQAFELSLHTFFFPNWRAYIDGAPAPTYARGALGLATVVVPPGDHAIVFRFENTFLRDFATALTLIIAGAGFARLLFARRRVALALIAIAIFVTALIAWHRRDDQPARIIPVSANLADQALLIGYATERADDALYVTLYWLGLREMDRDYTTFAHLLDANDSIIAQHDGTPDQGLTPTTRWLAGEIIADRHTLKPVSAGEFRLIAGMYHARADGFENIGARVDLGRVQISK